MKSILCASLSMILMMLSAYAASLPGDSADGKRLYDANCMGCHDTGIHTRKDRIVQSLDALEKRVGNCTHAAKKNSPRSADQRQYRQQASEVGKRAEKSIAWTEHSARTDDRGS